MPWWLVVALLVVFVASRPIEARLWRAGRLSDRTTTILILGRMPALVIVVCVAQGASALLTAGLIAISFLPMALGYSFFMSILAEQRAERQKQEAMVARP
jgi:hypothetical protein